MGLCMTLKRAGSPKDDGPAIDSRRPRARLAAGSDFAIRAAVLSTYRDRADRVVSNEELYEEVRRRSGMSAEQMSARVPVGRSAQAVNVAHRSARWAQQSLKKAGLLEPAGRRGEWRVTATGKEALTMAPRGQALVAFSTKLGVALWADCRDAAPVMNKPLHLVLASVPYPLAKQRWYGNPSRDEWLGFVIDACRAINGRLVPGSSVVLNVGADLFKPSSPARSTLPLQLVLELERQLGWELMDNLPWVNYSKPPGPVLYASIQRVQLNSTFEYCFWMTTCASEVSRFVDNRRVLRPHTKRHQRLIEQGGESQPRVSSDGAYRVRAGSYGRQTEGSIPRNVLVYGHADPSQMAYKKAARALGLPAHGAPFPLKLCRFLVEFLTPPAARCADIFAGSCSLPRACEDLGREWEAYDIAGEYLRGGATRFDGAWINPDLDRALGLMPAAA